MADNLNIQIRAKLDKASSISQINADIQEIRKELQHLEIKINIDPKQFRLINDSLNEFNKNLSRGIISTGGDNGLDKFQQKFKVVAGEAKVLTQEIRESVNQSGQMVKIIDDIDKETQKVISSTEILTDNYKRQRQEAEKIISQTEKQEQKRYINSNMATIKAIEQRNLAEKRSLDEIEKLEQQRYVRSNMAAIKAIEQRNLTEKKSIQQIGDFKLKMLGGGGMMGELDVFASKNPKYVQAVAKLKAEIQNLSASTPDAKNKIKQLEMQIASLKQQSAQAGTVLGRTLESFTKFLRFYLVGGLVVKTLGNIKKTISDIAEINKSMVMLERVSNASTSEIEAFMMRSPQMASDLGVLNKEVQSTTAEITKLGYSLQEAEKLMELSVIMKTVGNLRDVGDATNYLVSIMKAFKVEVQGATTIVDFLNHIANTTSINMGALGEGLRRMSSAMSEANNTITETTGLLVAGFDITRDAEKTSTALRTISINYNCGYTQQCA